MSPYENTLGRREWSFEGDEAKEYHIDEILSIGCPANTQG